LPAAKRAVVTGVGTGIGRAIAGALVDDGWEVLGVYNASSVAAQQLADERSSVELVKADLSDPAGVHQVIDAASSLGVQALVNNAAVIEFEKPGHFSTDLWRTTFEVNLFAPMALSFGLGERMPAGSGIVNITSTDSLRGSYSSAAYAASKAALANATLSLANILGPRGVRVNAVNPGWIATSMADLAAEQAEELTPLGRLGRPAEVAGCVRWLLSEESEFVHGSTLTADGGLINVDYVLLKESEKS
jgi:NAD(P)-dependent dehydrogenase (short-subunit alcohol dehydrogenase family)